MSRRRGAEKCAQGVRSFAIEFLAPENAALAVTAGAVARRLRAAVAAVAAAVAVAVVNNFASLHALAGHIRTECALQSLTHRGSFARR